MRNSSFEIQSGQKLNTDLYSIGFNLLCKKKSIDPNIEATLISASIEAINQKDNRLGGLLVDWMTIHHPRMNVDRLTRFILSLKSSQYQLVKIFWCANAQRFIATDQRFKRLSQLYKGKRINLADQYVNLKGKKKKVTHLMIQLKGEDERFKNTCIRIPNGYFSKRPNQIFPSSIIAKNHLSYRYRLMMGSSYRADIWAIMKRNSGISAYALAKKAHCSYRTAYIVKKDYEALAH